MAMPAVHAHAHDDDSLFQIQQPVEPPSLDSPANALLKRTVNRIRASRIHSMQAPSGMSFWDEIYRTIKQYCWPLGR
jgi:hypothetical protein